MHSVPIDIDTLPKDIAKLFRGLALYSDGKISVAYRQPMVIGKIVRMRDGEREIWSNIPLTLEAEQKLLLEPYDR